MFASGAIFTLGYKISAQKQLKSKKLRLWQAILGKFWAALHADLDPPQNNPGYAPDLSGRRLVY